MTKEAKMNEQNQSFVELPKNQQQFLDRLKVQGKSPNTVKNYKTDLDCFLTYWKKQRENLSLDGFGIPQVQEYGAFLDKKYNSDNSKRRRVQALRIFFDYLVELGHFKSNPVRSLLTSPKVVDIPRPVPYIHLKTLWNHLVRELKTSKDMDQILAHRNIMLFLFIYGAGLKVSQLANLKEDEIISSEEGYRVLIAPPKRDPYTVPLPPFFSQIYKDYKNSLEQAKRFSKISFSQILFNANPYKILSGGLSPRGIEIIFEDYKNKLMISLTPRSLRQACIFKWINQQNTETLIKEWMGVAPSYSLKPFKDLSDQNVYNESFLEEIYEKEGRVLT